ncbi:MAG: PBECR2 nuclease fold domain-containing protein [Candidatus Humimicrobiaceae bacterium]
MEIIQSKNNVFIRLTEERWLHITEEHSEMAGYYFEVLETIKTPEEIYQGLSEECIAIKEIAADKYIVVIYKETDQKDGFIITAFLTRKRKQFERRIRLWP